MNTQLSHHLTRLTLFVLVLVALACLMPGATPAHASLIGTITVNSLEDNLTVGDGKCTLREAIDNANFQSKVTDCTAPGTVLTGIQFSVSGTIELTAGGPLPIGSPAGSGVIINGGNAITVSGAGKTQIFNVYPGGYLSLQNLILTDGYSGSSYGGAIYMNSANLFLDHTTIQNSRTNGFAGGAIFALGGAITLQNNSIVQGNTGYDYGAINSTGAVTLTNSVMQNNVATAGGGALSVGGSVSLNNTLIYSNAASTNAGGGIYLTGSGHMLINGSQINANHADNSDGGGIFSQGVLTITQSTVTNNVAHSDGGGIHNVGTLAVTNSTVSSNHVTAIGGGGGIQNGNLASVTSSTISGNTSASSGGGLLNGSTLYLTNSTVSGNQADEDGGGIDTYYRTYLYNTTVAFNDAAPGHPGGLGGGINNRNANGAQTLVQNSLIVGNTTSRDLADCAGTIQVPSGRSLFQAVPAGDCTINTVGFGNYALITRPVIGLLTNNGGPTLTHALVPGSEAIDAGQQSCQDQNGVPLLKDQRGGARVGACDIGSFEYGSQVPWLWLPLIVR